MPGAGLQLQKSSGDSAKVVSQSNNCAASPAPGTSVVSDLGPDDKTNAETATISINFSQAGSYKVCYKVPGRNFVQVGATLLVVSAVLPTSFHDDGSVFVSQGTEQEFITFRGGSGMNLGSGKDKCKLIDWHDFCSTSAEPAGGSAEVVCAMVGTYPSMLL